MRRWFQFPTPSVSMSFRQGTFSSPPLNLGGLLGGFAQVGMANVTGQSVVSLHLRSPGAPTDFLCSCDAPRNCRLGLLVNKIQSQATASPAPQESCRTRHCLALQRCIKALLLVSEPRESLGKDSLREGLSMNQ